MNVLDLFSGIGGFSLGLERAGMRTVAFCEIEPFCQAVLRKHWPNVPIFGDIRFLNAGEDGRVIYWGGKKRELHDLGPIDVICGGFPCQDVSLAGRRAGLGKTRSGLWSEYRRLICEIRPRYVVVENTPGLLSLGMGTVLGDLAELRYDAEWYGIPAAYVGADHIRDRVWIIANSADGQPIHERWPTEPQAQVEQDASDAVRSRLSRWRDSRENEGDERNIVARPRLAFDAPPAFPREYRKHQPVLGRGVHGIPNRVDRIAALGNCVVPQIPEIIGRAIIAAENERS